MHLLGTLSNFDPRAATPLDLAHQGTVFVAMDARLHALFSGGTPEGQWKVARRVHGDLPLNPWPNTGWRFSDEASARTAYQTLRQHVLSRLPGVQPVDDRSPRRGLVDPGAAWAEAFLLNGKEVLFLYCDRLTEAKALTGITDRLQSFTVAGSDGRKGAVYSTQTAPHVVAIAPGQGGLVEQVLVAFTPGQEHEAVAAGLVESELDTKPFEIEVPSGILVLAWGRFDGRGWVGGAGQDPAAVLADLIGNSVARPLPTPWTSTPDAPHAWGLRVRPGKYRVGLRFLETEGGGISGMAMSHTEVASLWPDLGGGASSQGPSLAAAAAASQAAAARLAAGADGDADPLVFPGQPLARLSDYVRLMKAMQSGDMNGALRAAGLDMASYGAAAGAWGTRMAADAVLMNKFAAMMAKP